MINIESLKFLKSDEIKQIDEQFGTPTFVYDLELIRNNYKYFNNMPSAYGMTIRYSAKANPNQTILGIFNKLGASFDVSSTYEAVRCIKAGVAPEKILLTSQEASPNWIELCKQGLLFDAGSLVQLEEYGKNFPSTQVSIRVNPGFGSGLVKKTTTGGDHSSFGIWIDSLSNVKDIAKKYKLTIGRLHIHIGSGHEGVVLRKTVKVALKICDNFPDIKTLNLGGGYKIKTLITDPEYDHHATFAYTANLLKKYAKLTGRKLHLEVEPGTSLISPTGSLVTKVIDNVVTSKSKFFLKINAGLSELVRPSYYGVIHPLIIVNKDGNLPTNTKEYYVTGHCCSAGDTLSPKIGDSNDFHPIKLGVADINDYLIVERCGGYASSMCFKNFNSYPEASEILRISHSNYVLIRKRQDIDHMIQNEIAVDII